MRLEDQAVARFKPEYLAIDAVGNTPFQAIDEFKAGMNYGFGAASVVRLKRDEAGTQAAAGKPNRQIL